MALRKATSILKKTNLSKSEIILHNSGRPLDSMTYVHKYKSILNSYDFNTARNFLRFPMKSFHKFPSSILKNLIVDSFNIVMEKDTSNSKNLKIPNIEMYNILLSNYVDNEITDTVNEIILEMNENRIKFNLVTFLIMLRNYSKHGEMSHVEYLLEQMKSRNLKVDKSIWIDIVTGYIMTGQTDKAESIIAEHKIKENPDLIIGKAKGYASKGDVNNVMECIRKIDNSELNLYPIDIFNIYARLIHSKVPKTNLDELLQVMKTVGTPVSFSNAIFYLNRVGLYRDSLQLLEMFPTLIKLKVNDIVISFNAKECPIQTYKQALTILLNYNSRIENIFINIDFDEAYLFAEIVINSNNDHTICNSLLRKAIYDNSISEIADAINFSSRELKDYSLNTTLLFTFTPLILERGIVKNYEQLIQLLPQFQKSLLPASLMHCLMKGKYSEYSQLKANYKPKEIFFSCDYNHIAEEVVNNLSSTEIDKFAADVREIYHASVFEQIMMKIVVEKVNLAAEFGNEDGMKKAVELAETYQLMFSNIAIKNLIEQHPNRTELLKSLFEKHVRTSDIDNSSANVIVEPTESTENQSETVS